MSCLRWILHFVHISHNLTRWHQRLLWLMRFIIIDIGPFSKLTNQLTSSTYSISRRYSFSFHFIKLTIFKGLTAALSIRVPGLCCLAIHENSWLLSIDHFVHQQVWILFLDLRNIHLLVTVLLHSVGLLQTLGEYLSNALTILLLIQFLYTLLILGIGALKRINSSKALVPFFTRLSRNMRHSTWSCSSS